MLLLPPPPPPPLLLLPPPPLLLLLLRAGLRRGLGLGLRLRPLLLPVPEEPTCGRFLTATPRVLNGLHKSGQTFASFFGPLG